MQGFGPLLDCFVAAPLALTANAQTPTFGSRFRLLPSLGSPSCLPHCDRGQTMFSCMVPGSGAYALRRFERPNAASNCQLFPGLRLPSKFCIKRTLPNVAGVGNFPVLLALFVENTKISTVENPPFIGQGFIRLPI